MAVLWEISYQTHEFITMRLGLGSVSSLENILNPFRTKQELKNWKRKGNTKEVVGLNLFTFYIHDYANKSAKSANLNVY